MKSPFESQSFGVFVGQFKDKFMNQKHARHVSPKKQDRLLMKNQIRRAYVVGKKSKLKKPILIVSFP